MDKQDAGLKSLDHYKSRLPSWRYVPRQHLIPLVRWETPYLASLQSSLRTPALDSYFAFTANLGTHTFFMLVLPIFFWCGYTSLGRGLVHILASGVFISGFIKDLLCLPRPLSPPLQRITMSGSAALEYGFPSTHSTNAVSVAVYALLALNQPSSTVSSTAKLFLELLSYFYATSIIIGRVYCGMHGFFDVFIGSLLGAVVSVLQFSFIDDLDSFIQDGSFKGLSIVILIICVLVRIHPEPVDDCPCFDDSVAFAGVLCGVELGNFHFARSPLSLSTPVPATVPFQLEVLGWPKTILRILLGVSCIVAWRGIMKPTLLKGLPPIFRIVEKLGLSLPRRFFMQASEYDNVPGHIKTDSVIPSASELPDIISTIRHPGRRASISVGPQSEADAYEALAFRRRRRRESLSSVAEAISGRATRASRESKPLQETGVPRCAGNDNGGPIFPASQSPRQLIGHLGANLRANPVESNTSGIVRTPSQNRREDEKDKKEIFSKLEKPRVRYDVEVITKMIVYSGIAWLAVEGNPILFHYIGLGMDDARVT